MENDDASSMELSLVLSGLYLHRVAPAYNRSAGKWSTATFNGAGKSLHADTRRGQFEFAASIRASTEQTHSPETSLCNGQL